MLAGAYWLEATAPGVTQFRRLKETIWLERNEYVGTRGEDAETSLGRSGGLEGI